MKRYGATFALLILAVVLGLYFVVVENPREQAKDEQRERESRVIGLKEDEITSIEVITPSDRVVLERAEGGAWMVTRPVTAEADDGAVRRVLAQLTTMSVIRTLEGIEDLAQVGLAAPNVRVIARHAQGETTVEFGDANLAGSGVYVKRDDQKIFLTSASAKSTFDVTLDDVRRKEFLDFDPQAVTRVTITTAGRTLGLEQRPDGWVFGNPPRPADPDTVSSLLSRLRALRAMAFFDTPEQRAMVRIEPLPRTVVELMAHDRPVRVAFYDARGGGPGALYARTGNEKLYRVNENLLTEMPLDAVSLRDLRVVRIKSDDVMGIEVSLPTETYHLTRKVATWDLDGHSLGGGAADRIRDLLQAVAELKGESIVAETLSGVPESAVQHPVARLQLRGADGRVLATLTIGERSGDQRYAYSESSGPVFLIAHGVLDRIPSKLALESPQ